MIKRASSVDAPVLKGINKIAAGFTIIETMLFLAIAGLIFAGLVAGTNGTIRQQRYKDSVQGFVDDLRDLYSLAENTQVLDYDGTATCSDSTAKEGRGRSGCSVYGIYAVILPSDAGGDNVEAYWVTGLDQAQVESSSSDIVFMSKANVSTYTMTKSPDSYQAIEAKKHSLLWGADVAVPCSQIERAFGPLTDGACGAGKTMGQRKYGTAIFIYRSPITGSINTLTYSTQGDNAGSVAYNMRDSGQYLGFAISSFAHDDVSFCVTTGAGMSDGKGVRMVTVSGNGSNSNAVRLIEADAEENRCNK